MPRNSSGTYSLPAGNPVVTGTTISSTWANTTLSDIGTALTDSLSRSGDGGMTASLELAAGVIGAPGLSWTAETTSGLYRAGAGDFRYSISAADSLGITTNQISIPAGSAGAPGLSFLADLNSGIYRVGADQLGISAGGTLRWDVSTTVVTSTLPLRGSDGTVAAPAYSFTSDTDCGLYRIGANNIGLGVNGANVLNISTSGLAVTGTLSSSGAATLNSLGVTGNATVGGTLGVTGLSTLASLAVTNDASVGGNLTVTGTISGSNYTGFANPSATIGLSANNGSATTAMRSDASPALSQAIIPTWTGVHTFSARPVLNDGLTVNDSARSVASLTDTAITFGNSTDNPTYTFAGTGTASFNGSISISNDLTVSDDATIQGNLLCNTLAGTAASPNFQITSSSPNLGLFESDAAANNGLWVIRLVAEQLRMSVSNDAGSSTADFLTVDRTANTIDAINLSSTEVTSAGVIVGPVGAVGAPTFTFSGDTNTGIYRVGADSIGISTGGTVRLTVGPGVQVGAPTGGDQGAGTVNATGYYINGAQIVSGTYTPTLTGLLNIESTTSAICQYIRVGSVVSVSGVISVDCTAGTATATQLAVSLPIASNLATTTQLGGSGEHFFVGVSCTADTAGDRAFFDWLSNATSAQNLAFQFQYLIV